MTTDEELGRKIVPVHMSIGYGADDYAVVGDNARKVLAKPVATKDAVEAWLDCERRRETINQAKLIDVIYAALAHFAPPPSRLAGMTVEEIAAEFLGADTREDLVAYVYARVACRLAHEPAVDPDAGAKRIAAEFARATELGAQITPWEDMSEALRNGWRAVAAQQEKRGA